MSSPIARTEKNLAICLAVIAGYVDAYALQSFSTFVSFMSGNTTQTGSFIGQHRIAATLLSTIAILFFVSGTMAGTWLMQSGYRHSRRLVFGVVSALVGMGAGVGNVGSFPAAPQVDALSLAMGMMNTAVSRVGAEPISLTFVTGTLKKVGLHLALALRRVHLADSQGPFDTHFRRAILEAGVWCAFLTGAITSGAASSHFGATAMLLPFLTLLALAFFSSER